MKFITAAALASVASLALAAPSASLHQLQARELQKRQSLNEYKSGGCKSAIFFFSRGTFESGNVGSIIGPKVFAPLRKLWPDIAIQGVDYPAAVGGNLTPAGADTDGIKWAKSKFTEASTKCAGSMLVGGGYSQGAALMHRAVEALPKNVQDKIVAVILYGDTKNKQDGGRIKNFPPEKVKIFCNKDDGVCGGGLNVNAGHLAYGDSFQPGAQWVADKLKAAKGSFSSAPTSSGGEEGEAEASPKGAKAPSAKGKGGKGAGEGHGVEEMMRI